MASQFFWHCTCTYIQCNTNNVVNVVVFDFVFIFTINYFLLYCCVNNSHEIMEFSPLVTFDDVIVNVGV